MIKDGKFENRVLNKLFRSEKNEIIRNCIRLHVDKIYNLHYSPNVVRMTKSRRIRWARYEACIRRKRDDYRILAEKPEIRCQLERPRHRRGDNTTI
jgi:hypothetical protein